MNPQINQDNLFLILPFKVTQMALIYAKKIGIPVLDAIRFIYKSNTYKELEIEKSKLWHLGPVALVEYLMEHR